VSLVVVVLTHEEATDLTDRIRLSAEHLWSLLVESYERCAWSALGYPSWREYAIGEFDISQSYAYRLLDQARVMTAIEEVTGFSPMGEISERDARAIKPHLPEVLDDLRDRADAGLSKEDVVEALKGVVRDIKQREANDLAEKRARFHKKYEDNPDLLPKFVPTVPCPNCEGSGRLPKESA